MFKLWKFLLNLELLGLLLTVNAQVDPSSRLFTVCNALSGILNQCYTNTDMPLTATSMANCVCTPGPEVTVPVTVDWGELIDDSVSTCIEYFQTANPYFGSVLSNNFVDYCQLYGGNGGGGAFASATRGTLFSAAASTPSPMITEPPTLIPKSCTAILNLVTDCWSDTRVALTADNVVTCICAPPSGVSPAAFASAFNSGARECETIEANNPTAVTVFGFLGDYCTPIETRTASLTFSAESSQAGFIDITDVTGVPTNTRRSQTTQGTVVSPQSSGQNRNQGGVLPTGNSAPTAVTQCFGLKMYWVATIPIVLILIL